MTGNTTAITIYFVINADGEFEVGTDKDEAEDRYSSNIASSGLSITYAVEITDIDLPDSDPRRVRVSMKQKDESPAHMGEVGCFPRD